LSGYIFATKARIGKKLVKQQYLFHISPQYGELQPTKKVKGKGFPYSTPSVGPGADPGVQAVSLQVTVKSSTRR